MQLQVTAKVQLEIYTSYTRLIHKNSYDDEHEDWLKKIIKARDKKNRACNKLGLNLLESINNHPSQLPFPHLLD